MIIHWRIDQKCFVLARKHVRREYVLENLSTESHFAETRVWQSWTRLMARTWL